jgi:plasmid maintenance system antidote protein VapI
VNGRRGITPGTALRLAKFFDTSPDLWMNLQKNLDLWKAMKREGELLDDIQVFTGATTTAAPQ